MKLTDEDISLLKRWGFPEKDFSQIELAMQKSITLYTAGTKRITREEAIRLLGRETWLSGISRSAFHWDAARQTEDEKVTVYFDSNNLFRDGKD